MPARKPLPPALTRAPFAVRAALEAGVGEGRLYADDLDRPFHGARAARAHEEPPGETRDDRERRELIARCSALATLMKPGAHFSHVTAGRLWQCPLPQRYSATEPLHVTTPHPGRAIELGGTTGHQKRRPRTRVRHGFAVSDPAETWLDLAPLLTVDDLVAVGDHLILEPRRRDPRNPRPFVTLEQLHSRMRGFRGRGARTAASAITLMRQGAESRTETLLRLLLARAGFTNPVLQGEIRDARGRFLGYADLYWPEVRVVVEYDGEHHRTNDAAYHRDMTRIEDFVSAGNAVVRVRKQALFFEPNDVVRRVKRAFTR